MKIKTLFHVAISTRAVDRAHPSQSDILVLPKRPGLNFPGGGLTVGTDSTTRSLRSVNGSHSYGAVYDVMTSVTRGDIRHAAGR